MGKSQKNVSEFVLCLTEQLGLEWKKMMQQQTTEDKREKEGGFNSKRERKRKWCLLRENEEETNKQKKVSFEVRMWTSGVWFEEVILTSTGYRYEEAREEERLRSQHEDFSDMVVEVCYIFTLQIMY